MSELTLDQLAAGIQAQFGAISDDISLLRAQVKQVRDTFLRSTLTDVETTVNTINTTTGTINTTTGTINTTTGTINTTTGATSTKVITVESGLGSLTPDVIHPWQSNSLGPLIAAMAMAQPISATYPTINRAYYVPFAVTISRTIYKLFSANGSAVSGNIDVGIYNQAGTRLVSAGSTAQAGTGTLQVFDVADTSLDAGLYYLAVALDNTTGTLFRGATGVSPLNNGLFSVSYQVGAFPLPATATFTASSAITNYIPLIGASTRSDWA